MRQYDINGLVETHVIDSLASPLNGYKFHHNFRIKDNLSKRSSGGISILIKDTIKDGITVIKPTSAYYCWIKLNKCFFNMPKDIYVCFLHIPPENLSYSIKNGDQFDFLEQEILKFQI